MSFGHTPQRDCAGFKPDFPLIHIVNAALLCRLDQRNVKRTGGIWDRSDPRGRERSGRYRCGG